MVQVRVLAARSTCRNRPDRITNSYSCHRNERFEINIWYERLLCFLRYINQIHRLCVWYSFKQRDQIWSAAIGTIGSKSTFNKFCNKSDGLTGHFKGIQTLARQR